MNYTPCPTCGEYITTGHQCGTAFTVTNATYAPVLAVLTEETLAEIERRVEAAIRRVLAEPKS